MSGFREGEGEGREGGGDLESAWKPDAVLGGTERLLAPDSGGAIRDEEGE